MTAALILPQSPNKDLVSQIIPVHRSYQSLDPFFFSTSTIVQRLSCHVISSYRDYYLAAP